MGFLYLDCFSGVSGDMIVGALLDCGVPGKLLQSAIKGLGIEAALSWEKKNIGGISSSSFQVRATATPPLRHLSDIESIISNSSLPPYIIENSLSVFYNLAEAEASVHGINVEQVHFHEIGAVDTIVDVVATFICLNYLAIEQVYTSTLPWNEGIIDIDHGRYPLPAPATALLLQGLPCTFSSADIELVTPTGAAILFTMATRAPIPEAFIPRKIGYGAGKRTRKDAVPNLLRAIIADFLPISQKEEIAVIETQVDDLNPEVFSHLFQVFISHPAVLDFFTTPILMKKNRPGTLITMLTQPQHIHELSCRLMQESGSLGVRYRLQKRLTAQRSEFMLESPWGPIRVKAAHLPGGEMRFKPEYQDCQAIALRQNLALLEVYSAINKLLPQQQE